MSRATFIYWNVNNISAILINIPMDKSCSTAVDTRGLPPKSQVLSSKMAKKIIGSGYKKLNQ